MSAQSNPKDRRRSPRTRAPLFVMQDNYRALAKDWSLVGLKTSRPPYAMTQVGDVVCLTLYLPRPNLQVSIKCTARVVRIDQATNSIAYQYVSVGPMEYELLEGYFNEVVRTEVS